MALPNSFSNNTTPTGVQLDANFAALGAIMTIPCAASGSNTLVLTPAANTPAVAAYANGQRYSGIAVSTNTGATTARVGGLAALNVYYDGPAGPAALAGNEIIANCAFTLVYDSTLNSSAGGFHLISSPAALGIAGGTINNGTLSFVNGTLSTLILSGAGVTGNTLTGKSIVVGGTLSGTVGTLGLLSVGASAASITRILSGLGTLAYSLIAVQTAQDQNMALAGVQLGDSISLGYTLGQTNTVFSGYVPAAGTVAVRAMNAGAATLGAFTLVTRATAHGFT